LSTTGSVPQLGPAATGASVAAGGSVAGDLVATDSVAGTSVAAGAAVVAGVPHAERSMDTRINRLTKDHDRDFLFISLSPLLA
jgi:hypothetical protein